MAITRGYSTPTTTTFGVSLPLSTTIENQYVFNECSDITINIGGVEEITETNTEEEAGDTE